MCRENRTQMHCSDTDPLLPRQRLSQGGSSGCARVCAGDFLDDFVYLAALLFIRFLAPLIEKCFIYERLVFRFVDYTFGKEYKFAIIVIRGSLTPSAKKVIIQRLIPPLLIIMRQ